MSPERDTKHSSRTFREQSVVGKVSSPHKSTCYLTNGSGKIKWQILVTCKICHLPFFPCRQALFLKDEFPGNVPGAKRRRKGIKSPQKYVLLNERQWKNQMANFGNVQNLPFAFFPLPPSIISKRGVPRQRRGSKALSERRGQSTARVVGEDGLLPGGGVDVGVDLSGGNALVAEHLLDDT